MKIDIKIPRITEYKGIVFRSKSEAICARAFDLCDCKVEYEPEYLGINNWIPDFKITRKNEISIVEYKPAPVTETYLKFLQQNFISLLIKYPKYEFGLLVKSYNDKFCFGFSLEEGVLKKYNKDTFDDSFLEAWETAKQYRFDLIDGGQ